MQVGDLVTSKWMDGTIGVLVDKHDEFRDEDGYCAIAWEILWINSNPAMTKTVEDEEDLEVLDVQNGQKLTETKSNNRL